MKSNLVNYLNKKEKNMEYEDTIIFDDDNYNGGYPWKGAIIAFGGLAIAIFCIIIPWIVGWIKILTWIF